MAHDGPCGFELRNWTSESHVRWHSSTLPFRRHDPTRDHRLSLTPDLEVQIWDVRPQCRVESSPAQCTSISRFACLCRVLCGKWQQYWQRRRPCHHADFGVSGALPAPPKCLEIHLPKNTTGPPISAAGPRPGCKAMTTCTVWSEVSFRLQELGIPAFLL